MPRSCFRLFSGIKRGNKQFCHQFINKESLQTHPKFKKMANEHHVTLLPTRLREFEERNEHAFLHKFIGSHNSGRRKSSESYGDQYVRHPSPVDVLMQEEDEAFNAFQRIFRDLSTGAVEAARLETNKIPLILGKLGQEYDKVELEHWIKGQDRHGFIDFDGYQRICVHFIKDPKAIERAKEKDFDMSNLLVDKSA